MSNKENRMITVWAILSLLVMFAYPVCACIIFKTAPDFFNLIKGILPMIVALYPGAIACVFLYIPLIGKTGAYLGFLTGNISNIRLPCAINAVGQLRGDASLEEKDTVSTLSVAASALTTIAIISFGLLYVYNYGDAFLGAESKINPVFQQVLPALFGALSYKYFKKDKGIFISVILLLVALLAIKGSFGMSALIVFAIAFAVVLAFIKSYIHGKRQRTE
ncbi:MAG: hypothetical protein IJN85_02640 [Oscillospiraceae bacterium]|nr:hypothetical protein [Oscillospiraceae bacterium]